MFGIIVAILVVIFSIYSLYPRSGSFNHLILIKYSEPKFRTLNLSNLKYGSLNIRCEDIDKINKVLSYLGELKLVEYKSEKIDENDDIYDIGFYGDNPLGITVYNENLIQVYVGIAHEIRMYKITDNKLDIKYIEGLIKN